jgi:hypothetical protein
MWHRYAGLITTVCIAATWAPPASAQLGKIKVGQPFPTIVFPSLKGGKPMSIADFRGKNVVLHVFASW